MVAIRLTRLRARSAGPSIRLLRLRAIGAAIDPDPGSSEVRVRLTRLRAIGGAALTALEARGGPDQTVSAFQTVVLDGRSSIASTSMVWSQTGGTPTVALSTVAGLPPSDAYGNAYGDAYQADSAPGAPSSDAYSDIYSDIYLADVVAGPVRQFEAPAVAAGTTLVFRLQVTDGINTATDSVNVTVLPWQHWRYDGTTWTAQRTYFI
jgi:hypothetical protein